MTRNASVSTQEHRPKRENARVQSSLSVHLTVSMGTRMKIIITNNNSYPNDEPDKMCKLNIVIK